MIGETALWLGGFVTESCDRQDILHGPLALVGFTGALINIYTAHTMALLKHQLEYARPSNLTDV